MKNIMLARIEQARHFFNDKKRIRNFTIITWLITFIVYGLTIWLYIKFVLNIKDLSTIIFLSIATFMLLLLVPDCLAHTITWIYHKFKMKDLGFNNVKILSKFAKLPKEMPSVALIHLCANDFIPECMDKCLKVKYMKLDFYLCDDSTKEECIKTVDDYVKIRKCQLHRRPNEHKKKYPTKGGNWHYFLHHIGYKYDYIVFTDSGTILQPDFIEKNIRLFYAGVENLAIVQGYHCAYAKFSLWEKIMYKWDETFHRHTVGSLNNIYSAAFCNGFAFIVKTKCLMEIPINKVNVYTCDQAISFFFWKKYKSLYSPLSVAMKIRSLTFFSNIMQLAKWCSTDWRSIVSPKNHTLPILSTAWGFWWFLSTWGRWISIFFINIVFPVMLVFGQINPYLIITNVWVLLPSLLFLLSFGILTIWGMFYDVKSLLSSILFLLFYLTVGNYLKLILVFVAFSKILHIKINYHVTEKNNFVEKSWKTTFKLIWKYNLCIMLFIIFLMTSYFVWTCKTSHFDLITFTLFCGVISQLVNAMIIPFVLNTFSYLKMPKSRGDVYNYKKWIIDDFKYLKDK